MLTRISKLLLVACLITGTLWAANDPFVGKWKMDQSRSKITGEQVKIKNLGGNKYTISFGNISNTLVANGTDQPVHFGRTVSLTMEGPNAWKRVTKKDGRILGISTWTIMPGGKTINIEGTVYRADGAKSSEHVVIRRISGTRGFAGTWQSTKLKIGSPEEQEIRPYGADGLSFVSPADHETLSMNFDGKDYPDHGPNVAAGSVSSGRRLNQRTLVMTDKVQGKVMDTTWYKVSPNGKTMTLTIHETGQPHPLTIVYDRE